MTGRIRDVLAVTLIALLGGTVSAQICLYTTTSACGTSPAAITVGDLNGDLRPDVVVGNLSAGTISVLLNTGAGFGAPLAYAAGEQPWGVAVGDLNGDQLSDVVVANYGASSSNVHVRFNLGGGVLGPAQTLIAGARPITPVVIDVDGDHDNDIVVTNFAGNSFSVLKNNGNGTFATAVSYATGLSPQGLACADVNGDERPDVVTCDINSDTVSIFLNNGNGTFGARAVLETNNEPYYCVFADFDGDGDRDLAVTTFNGGQTGTVSVFRNYGNGTLLGPSTYLGGNGPIGIAAADFDGDCDIDLLVSQYSSPAARVLVNNGLGSFDGSSIANLPGNGYGAAAADVDGDGAPDGIVAMRQSTNVAVMRNGCWVIWLQPGSTRVCPLASAEFSVESNSGIVFTWRKDGVPLSDGPTGTGSSVAGSHLTDLSISGCSKADEGTYDCVVATACNERISDGAVLTLCAPDFDCDGFVTGQDFDLFVQAFEAGDESADFDGDGFITGVDFDAYVQAFEAGC